MTCSAMSSLTADRTVNAQERAKNEHDIESRPLCLGLIKLLKSSIFIDNQT